MPRENDTAVLMTKLVVEQHRAKRICASTRVTGLCTFSGRKWCLILKYATKMVTGDIYLHSYSASKQPRCYSGAFSTLILARRPMEQRNNPSKQMKEGNTLRKQIDFCACDCTFAFFCPFLFDDCSRFHESRYYKKRKTPFCFSNLKKKNHSWI